MSNKHTHILKSCQASVDFDTKQIWLQGSIQVGSLESLENMIDFLSDMRKVLYKGEILEPGVEVNTPKGKGTVLEIRGSEDHEGDGR